MAEDDSGEKTEDATQRRRDEYRQNGQLAKSQDVLSLLILAVGLSYFLFFGLFNLYSILYGPPYSSGFTG